MKRGLAFCLLLLLPLSVGCQKSYPDAEALLPRVRQQLRTDAAADVTYAGMVGRDGMALLWYGGDGVGYSAIECRLVGAAEYEYVRTYTPTETAQGIFLLPWRGGYAFCIGNPDCRTVRITDSAGTYTVTPERHPFVFYNATIPTDCRFFDIKGDTIP